MEYALYIIIFLLGLIWWRLGLISDKLNKDFSDDDDWERKQQREEFLEESKNISDRLDTISDYLDKIDKNTDADYQRKKAEFGE